MTREETLKIAKPILFNTDMVRAIQDGRKNVTRRPINVDTEFPQACKSVENPVGLMTASQIIRPNYKVGDILYVRETWGRYSICEGIMPKIYYKADENAPDKIKWIPSIHMPKEAARIFLRVTGVRAERLQGIITGNYKTPININREGLIAPCGHCTHHNGDCKDFIAQNSCCLLDEFVKLWNSTIEKSKRDKYGWEANPWVWVIEFERLEVTE